MGKWDPEDVAGRRLYASIWHFIICNSTQFDQEMKSRGMYMHDWLKKGRNASIVSKFVSKFVSKIVSKCFNCSKFGFTKGCLKIGQTAGMWGVLLLVIWKWRCGVPLNYVIQKCTSSQHFHFGLHLTPKLFVR